MTNFSQQRYSYFVHEPYSEASNPTVVLFVFKLLPWTCSKSEKKARAHQELALGESDIISSHCLGHHVVK
jgi:hypothetical protein